MPEHPVVPSAVPIRDCGEPFVALDGSIRFRAQDHLGDDRAGRVRLGVVERLRAAEGDLPEGVHLLVWRGHRWSVEILEESLLAGQSPHDDVDPHASGAAIDVTLCDEVGRELDLSTSRSRTEASDYRADAHRELLATVLTDHGFVNSSPHWWHWSYGDCGWAMAVGAPAAVYGVASAAFDLPADAQALAVLQRCTNAGRWGASDVLGTLNHITPDVRMAAASLVRTGRALSLAKPIDVRPSAVNPRPAWHVMHLETERPYATADSLHLQIHGLATTHFDALGHMFLDGVGYNGNRQSDVVTDQGVSPLDIQAMADGIVTRGVLLDVAAAHGRPWLPAGTAVGVVDLEAAEHRQGVRIGAGDAVFVHIGLERREATEGPEDPAVRAGLDVSAVEWLQEREVAVYSGDCIEAFPQRGRAVEMPLHQIGIARMGLALLDCPTLTRLLDLCHELDRWEFLLTAAPLVVPGGTGSPVNPVAVF